MSMGDYLETMTMAAIFGTGTFTEPATIDVALWVGDPTDTGAGGAEVTGTGYSRQSLATDGTDWTGSGGAWSNGVAITFGPSGGAWSTGSAITHFVLFAGGGNDELFVGALGTSRTVDASGITLEFAIGDLDVTLD